MTTWDENRGEWSWRRSLLLKSGIMGFGICVILWAGWPKPQNGNLDHSSSPIVLSEAKTIQEVHAALPPVTSISKTESPKALAKKNKKINLESRVALLVDLNGSSRIELETLPGIGAVLAERILTYRSIHGDFQQIHELVNVSGIGRKRLGRLAPLVKIEKRKS